VTKKNYRDHNVLQTYLVFNFFFYCFQSILVQIRSEILSDPRVRLDGNPDKEYGEAEAKDAFRRMVDRYGWNK